MTIRKILVPLTGIGDETAAVESALTVARRLKAHVEIFHAAVDPRDAVAFVGEGMTSAMIEQIMSAAETEGKERSVRVRDLFDKICTRDAVPRANRPGSGGFSAEYVQRVGREDDLVAEQGRVADLIVTCKPPAEEQPNRSLALETALRGTGRPVLIVPEAMREGYGKTVAIAWNGSIEVSRAVGLSMPFLEHADRVVVLSVDEPSSYGPPAADAIGYLAWHGIKADGAALQSGERPQGQTLLAAAAEHGADLMVQGAYTRSRMKRLIFGGVTGEVLARTTIPVVMTH